MATTRRATGQTGDGNGDFIDRMVEFKNRLGVLETDIEKAKQVFSDAGKKVRELEKEKAATMEAITKYVLSAQKDLI